MDYVPVAFLRMFGLFAVFFVAMIALAIALMQRRGVARKEYDAALEAYRNSPNDPILRTAMLVRGREYSRMTRGAYGRVGFDEAGIQNDIDMVESARRAVPSPSVGSAVDHAERLRALASLREQGLITDDEYAARRAEVIGEI